MKNILFIFGQLTDEDVDWLTKVGAPSPVPSGTVLIREGEPVANIYILLDGELAVTRGSQLQEIARLESGEMIGEVSFVDASPPSASVTATTDSFVLEISREMLARRIETDTGFSSRFYRALAMMLSDRLRSAMDSRYGAIQADYDGALEPDELDPNAIESLTRAGERFDRMLRECREF